jgi:hypothetical protein
MSIRVASSRGAAGGHPDALHQTYLGMSLPTEVRLRGIPLIYGLSTLFEVAGHGQDVGILLRLDAARGGDDAIVELAESLGEFCADALRRAGNEDDLW